MSLECSKTLENSTIRSLSNARESGESLRTLRLCLIVILQSFTFPMKRSQESCYYRAVGVYPQDKVYINDVIISGNFSTKDTCY